MLRYSEPKRIRQGELISASGYNTLLDSVGASTLSVDPTGPMEISRTPGGNLLRWVGEKQYLAQITGSSGSNPVYYSWQEVYPNGDGTYTIKPGGVSGSTASGYLLELNNAVLSVGAVLPCWRGLGDYFYALCPFPSVFVPLSSYYPFTRLQFGPTTSWTVTAPSAGLALVSLNPASPTNDGSMADVYTLPIQGFSGYKWFRDTDSSLELCPTDPSLGVPARYCSWGYRGSSDIYGIGTKGASNSLDIIIDPNGAILQIQNPNYLSGTHSYLQVDNKIGVWGTSGGGDTVSGGIITSLGSGSGSSPVLNYITSLNNL